jgi:hypothetical protein
MIIGSTTSCIIALTWAGVKVREIALASCLHAEYRAVPLDIVPGPRVSVRRRSWLMRGTCL